jgi:hypothetical protein
MWWIVGACSLVVLAGAELRRVLRERADEAATRRYALYTPDRPDEAIMLVEIMADVADAPVAAPDPDKPVRSTPKAESAPPTAEPAQAPQSIPAAH